MVKRPHVIIRKVEHTDYEQLGQFFIANNIEQITRQFHPFPLNTQTAHYIACISHRDRYYIAIWNKRIIGLCMLRGWDGGLEIPSFGVFVDYRYHTKGLGRQLTEFILTEAKILGCRSVRLSVYASNLHAVRLYISLGFREINRRGVYVTGGLDEKIIMRKDLI
jgi:ribosomal protein S18 acetylase RimI-like enzyme